MNKKMMHEIFQLFFHTGPQNLMCILHLLCFSIPTSHSSSAQWSHMTSGYHNGQHNLKLIITVQVIGRFGFKVRLHLLIIKAI